MSGVGAFIVGAAVGAVAAKSAQKKHDKHKYQQQHYQTSRTVVVHQPPHQVPNQTHLVYVNNAPGAHHHGHGYPHGVPHGPSHGHPSHGVHHGYPQGPTHGYPHGHQPPHYGPPQAHSTVIYHQSVTESPGYPPAIGFAGSPQGPPPPSSYPSPYPPPAVPCAYPNPPAPPQQGGYPPAPQYDAYPPLQAPGYPPTPSGYPSNGYPPMPSSSQYPPPPPQASVFQAPPAHPQPASAAPAQAIQAQVTVHLTAASNQQCNAGRNPATRPDRRCFVVLNEETRYALQVDTTSGSRLVMRQRTATGSWDPQWSSGQAQCQGQTWYIDGEGIIRSQLNDFAIEAKDGGSWLCLAPYSGDSRQQWIVREGRILSNKVSPSDCICLEEGLMGTAVNADVIVTKYQARRNHHWVIEYI